jgi:capsular polysaccharide biosynthesis protein
MVGRRWHLIVAAAAVGLVLGLALTALQKPTYRATASVLVTPTGVQNSADLANGRTNTEINLDTEAQLMRSTEVADRVRRMLRSSASANDLVKKVEVTVPPNTEVLSISFVADSPNMAQAGAHAFAVGYLEQRASTAQAKLDDQVKKVQAVSSGLGATLRGIADKLTKLPNASPDRAYAAAQRNLLTTQLSALNQLLGRLTTTVVTPGRLLTDAQLPTAPRSPSRWVNVASGLAAGLLVGVLLAWARGRRDHRMFQPAQVQRTLGLPVVATVPAVRTDEVESGRTPAGQAYRRLANILPGVLEDSPGVILVAAATPGVAGPVVATNLAAALARAGATTTLLQVGRSSRFCALLAGADEAGADVLSLPSLSTEEGMLRPRFVRQRVPGLPTLAVVSSIPDRDDDPPMMNGSTRGILEQLRLRDDYLVVTAPSTATGADAQAWAARSDAVILVVELRTTREQALDALAQFDDMRAPVLGTVVVPRSRRAGPAVGTVPAAELAHVGPPNGLATALAGPAAQDGAWEPMTHVPAARKHEEQTGSTSAPTGAPDDQPRPR